MVTIQPTVMNSRWAVEIEGHNATITRLETYLADSLLKPTDTFISRLRDIPVIRTQLWDAVKDTDVVEQLAQAELYLLQGLTKLAGGASPLSVGTIFELGVDDIILNQTRRSVNDVYVLDNTIDAAPTFRQRMEVVRRHDALAGAVLELSGRPDWIKIYKTVEYLEEHFGGEKKLAATLPTKSTALKRIKRTSQSVRHRARSFASINNPYKLEDAETFLQALVKDVIASVVLPAAHTDRGAYVIPRRDYPADQVIGLKPLILVNGAESAVAFPGDALTTV